MPVSAYADWSDFNIYLNDVGLLSCLADVTQNYLLHYESSPKKEYLIK
jgi:hypothetical protein